MDKEKMAKKAMRGDTKAYGELIHLYQEYLYSVAFLHVKMNRLHWTWFPNVS